MRIGLLFLVAITLTGCATTSSLHEGLWTGSISPMNHPEAVTQIQFMVTTNSQQLSIVLIGPDANEIALIDPVVDRGNLYYSFREPEQGVLLTCHLERRERDIYEGKCSDPDGK